MCTRDSLSRRSPRFSDYERRPKPELTDAQREAAIYAPTRESDQLDRTCYCAECVAWREEQARP